MTESKRFYKLKEMASKLTNKEILDRIIHISFESSDGCLAGASLEELRAYREYLLEKLGE
jgi:hypothetical protein